MVNIVGINRITNENKASGCKHKFFSMKDGVFCINCHQELFYDDHSILPLRVKSESE